MKLSPEQQRQAAKNLRERAALAKDEDYKAKALNYAAILESLAKLQESRAKNGIF